MVRGILRPRTKVAEGVGASRVASVTPKGRPYGTSDRFYADQRSISAIFFRLSARQMQACPIMTVC
jgi:hypothetical protein